MTAHSAVGLLKCEGIMNAYETARALGLTGTDQQIVDILRSLSQANIPAAKVRLWLSDHGLLAWDGSGWFGLLQDQAPQLSAELQGGLRDLKARVLAGDPIRSADPVFAPKVLRIIAGIAAAMPGIAELVNSFYALDGNRPWKDLTVEQFQADRSATDTDEQFAITRSVIEQRITNSVALARERISPSDSPEVQAQKWAQAWLDGV